MNEMLISPLVNQQLPGFVRDDYPLFVKFIEKYYEWMELSGNPVYESGKFKYVNDVDNAESFYIEQIKKEFLPYFPQISVLDTAKFIKFVNRFYVSKGTPDSVKFLFRALFNEDIEITFPKDDVLKVSDGKWVLPLALRIETNDIDILKIENCLLTGQTSKATAVVEKVIKSVDRQLGISYTEAYVSNVDRLFTTGETVVATYNDGINDITVSGKLIGALSEIKVEPKNRGSYYNSYDPLTGYPGDPLSIIGGLNSESGNPIGAVAYVGSTTKGSISDIVVIDGGFGFRDPSVYTNSSIIDFKNGYDSTRQATEASAQISLLDFSTSRAMSVSNTTIETIYSLTLDEASQNSNVQNSSVSTLSDYQNFNVYPISYITITGSGGGYTSKPDVDVHSLYNEENEDLLVIYSAVILKDTSIITDTSQDLTVSFQVGDNIRLYSYNKYESVCKITQVTTNTITVDQVFGNEITDVQVYKIMRNFITDLGSLGRLVIENPGSGYAVNQYLNFEGGTGYGANAKITSVYANNGIKTVSFMPTPEFVIGGEGYTSDNLPTVTVSNTSGINAVLRVSEIVGNGEKLGLSTTRIGAVSSIRVISYGYDYSSVPIVSLRNADIITANITQGQIFSSNTLVYQGSSNTTSTWSAYVDSFDESTGLLRIFDYKGTFDKTKPIVSDDGIVNSEVVDITVYGDGLAKASAKFENGLIRYPGIYLNTDGHISSDKKIQDGSYYHNFSYVINTERDYSSFKNPLNDIIHPIGTKTFVNRLNDNIFELEEELSNEFVIEYELTNYNFSVNVGENNIVSSNVFANVASQVNVGDVIIVSNLLKMLSGTANTEYESNNVIGINTNYLNQLQDNDVVVLSTGNTEIVKTVTSNNSFVTQNTIGVTSTGTTINVLFNETKTVTFANANTILVDTVFVSSSNNVVLTVQKLISSNIVVHPNMDYQLQSDYITAIQPNKNVLDGQLLNDSLISMSLVKDTIQDNQIVLNTGTVYKYDYTDTLYFVSGSDYVGNVVAVLSN